LQNAAQFPVYASAKQMTQACKLAIAKAKRKEAALAAVPSTKALAAMDDYFLELYDVVNPIDFMSNVHPDKDVRDAGEACSQEAQKFQTQFSQNPKIFAKLNTVKPTDEVERRLQKDWLDDFIDSGVSLDADKRKQVRELSERMTKLSQDFDRNIREANIKLPYTAEELKGVPAKAYEKAKKDEQGRYLLGVDYPTLEPVMTYADNAATRERMWRAKQNEGGMTNIKMLGELAQLRKQYAALFGYESYADFTLRRRMGASSQKVDAFLNDVKKAVTQGEVRDIEELKSAKATDLKLEPSKTTFNRWDSMYYTERVRKAKYSVEEEQFRQYFPPEASLKFVFKFAEDLFGVKFTPVQRKLWHPEAKAFIVTNSADNAYLATFYTDIYPRENKYNHAAVWSYRDVASRIGRRPSAAMVTNFNREGLTIGELETLLHEFGHGVHAMLSQSRYAAQGGTNVLRDFVEAPSQMLEEWVYQPEVLALFQQVCAECKPVPKDLLEAAKRSRGFAKGMRYARQHLYATYDLALHAKDPQDALALWAKMEGATPLGYVPDTLFPAGFGHLAGGYAAGYYGYLWSEVIAKDMQTAFEGDWLNANTGAKYRNTVLANGGQRAPQALVKDFLGRESNSAAFYKFLESRIAQ
jgi:thimet oligopeptidase